MSRLGGNLRDRSQLLRIRVVPDALRSAHGVRAVKRNLAARLQFARFPGDAEHEPVARPGSSRKFPPDRPERAIAKLSAFRAECAKKGKPGPVYPRLADRIAVTVPSPRSL